MMKAIYFQCWDNLVYASYDHDKLRNRHSQYREKRFIIYIILDHFYLKDRIVIKPDRRRQPCRQASQRHEQSSRTRYRTRQ